VNLYRFDTTTDKSSDNSNDTTSVIAVRPSINSINNNKPSKLIKQVRTKTKFSPPSIEEVKAFFLESNSLESEAENFHNYFESNGWLVGGKAKMKNWKAAAGNWIKRAQNFKGSKSTNERLSTNNNKDYSIPL
jgi:hypothetical protein